MCADLRREARGRFWQATEHAAEATRVLLPRSVFGWHQRTPASQRGGEAGAPGKSTDGGAETINRTAAFGWLRIGRSSLPQDAAPESGSRTRAPPTRRPHEREGMMQTGSADLRFM